MPFDGILYQDDEILRVLRAAQERIRKPENWCQGAYGDHRSDHSELCAWGAIKWATRDEWPAAMVLNVAAHKLGFGSAGALNDGTNHPTVMHMFSRAIELRLAEIMETVTA